MRWEFRRVFVVVVVLWHGTAKFKQCGKSNQCLCRKILPATMKRSCSSMECGSLPQFYDLPNEVVSRILVSSMRKHGLTTFWRLCLVSKRFHWVPVIIRTTYAKDFGQHGRSLVSFVETTSKFC